MQASVVRYITWKSVYGAASYYTGDYFTMRDNQSDNVDRNSISKDKSFIDDVCSDILPNKGVRNISTSCDRIRRCDDVSYLPTAWFIAIQDIMRIWARVHDGLSLFNFAENMKICCEL